MQKRLLKIIFTLTLIFSAWCASTQYNKDYFFNMGRKLTTNNDYQEAIRVLNVLLRFDNNAYEGYKKHYTRTHMPISSGSRFIF